MTGRGRPPRVNACESWLTAYLSGGKRPVDDILHAGSIQIPPYRERTLRKAKSVLGFISGRDGFGPQSTCYWRDPAVPEAEPIKDATNAELLEAIQGLKEDSRLAKPPVTAASTSSASTLGRGVAVNWDDPDDPTVQRIKAKHEAERQAEARMVELRNVIHHPEPFAFLYSTDIVSEIIEMSQAVRYHVNALEQRNKGTLKYRKARKVVEQVTEQVPEMALINGVFEPTGKLKDEVKDVITYVDDPKGEVLMPDGYENGEDLSEELDRWNRFLASAKERKNKLQNKLQNQPSPTAIKAVQAVGNGH